MVLCTGKHRRLFVGRKSICGEVNSTASLSQPKMLWCQQQQYSSGKIVQEEGRPRMFCLKRCWPRPSMRLKKPLSKALALALLEKLSEPEGTDATQVGARSVCSAGILPQWMQACRSTDAWFAQQGCSCCHSIRDHLHLHLRNSPRKEGWAHDRSGSPRNRSPLPRPPTSCPCRRLALETRQVGVSSAHKRSSYCKLFEGGGN